MDKEIKEESKTEMVEEPAEDVKVDVKSENEMLKAELAKAQETIQHLEQEVTKMSTELNEYREIAEQKTKDAAWQKQVVRLPEKYRTDETRKLYETNPEGFIDLLANLLMMKDESDRTAEGIRYSIATDEKLANKVADLGYELIVK